MLATSSEMPKVLAGRREGTLDLVAVDQARLATGRARAARQAVGDLRDIGLGLNRTTSFVCSTMPSASQRGPLSGHHSANCSASSPRSTAVRNCRSLYSAKCRAARGPRHTIEAAERLPSTAALSNLGSQLT